MKTFEDYCIYYLKPFSQLEEYELRFCACFGQSCDGCCQVLKGAVPVG